MEAQLEALRRELAAMKTVTETEINKLRERALLAEAQVTQLTQVANAPVAATVASSVADALKEGLKSIKGSGENRNVVDTKGIGKPFTFTSEECKFQEWGQRVENYFVAIHGEAMRPMFEWAGEQDQTIDSDLSELADPESTPLEEVPEELRELNTQLYHLLVNLTSGESFELVNHSDLRGNGAEAWRIFMKRYDHL